MTRAVHVLDLLLTLMCSGGRWSFGLFLVQCVHLHRRYQRAQMLHVLLVSRVTGSTHPVLVEHEQTLEYYLESVKLSAITNP